MMKNNGSNGGSDFKAKKLTVEDLKKVIGGTHVQPHEIAVEDSAGNKGSAKSAV